MGLFLETVDLVGNLGVDSWLGSAAFLKREPIHEVHSYAAQLKAKTSGSRSHPGSVLPKIDHVSWADQHSHVYDRDIDREIFSGDGYANRQRSKIQQHFAKLRSGEISLAESSQIKADIAAIMRDKVNPMARKIKQFDDFAKIKIAKREAARDSRGGVLSHIETKELKDLRADRAVFANAHAQLQEHQQTFTQLDGEHRLFTSGERFRRNGLDNLHATLRFCGRHRIIISSTITTLLVLSTINTFLHYRNRRLTTGHLD